jgi:hypothetical protein
LSSGSSVIAYAGDVPSGGRSSEELAWSRNFAASITAVFVAGLGVAEAADGPAWLKIGLASICVVGATVAVVFHRLERQATRREAIDRDRQERAERERRRTAAEAKRLARLRTTVPGRRETIPRMRDLSPYELGVDREAVVPERLPGVVVNDEYIRRDRDSALREALDDAAATGHPALIVVRGRSKAGKSRTLFEALRRHPELRNATLIAPNPDVRSLTALLAPGGLPDVAPGPMVLWLDDLEYFLAAGARGMNAQALERPVVRLQRNRNG